MSVERIRFFNKLIISRVILHWSLEKGRKFAKVCSTKTKVKIVCVSSGIAMNFVARRGHENVINMTLVLYATKLKIDFKILSLGTVNRHVKSSSLSVTKNVKQINASG